MPRWPKGNPAGVTARNSLQGTAQACPDSRRTATLHKQCVNGNQTHKQGTQGSTFAQ